MSAGDSGMNGRLSLKLATATFGLAISLVVFVVPAEAAKRVALVIGNNDYKNVPKLQKAVNDARTMGDTLKQLGFSVMLAENQTRQAFSETLVETGTVNAQHLALYSSTIPGVQGKIIELAPEGQAVQPGGQQVGTGTPRYLQDFQCHGW